MSTATSPRFALTLHVGMGKTGTTSLQVFLRQHREELLASGCLYPRSIGPGRHAAFGMWLRPQDEVEAAWQARRPGTLRFDGAEDLRREVPRRLFAELARTGAGGILMSDEALLSSTRPALERLRAFADEHVTRLRVVCYLRRQDDHLVSRYQQALKGGETRTLARRLAEMDPVQTYDYHARLRAWQDTARPDELVVRPFETARLRNGSLYDDFVHAAGLDVSTDDPPPRRNESLDAESAELLRLLNLLGRERPDLDLPDNRSLLDQLHEVGGGDTLTVPEADLDRFMDRWAASNEQVAREFLGEPDGVLFRAPRRTSRTTTVQRLRPERLEELLSALPQLGEDVVVPLRAVAAREAASDDVPH